jgi:hypothetical protein
MLQAPRLKGRFDTRGPAVGDRAEGIMGGFVRRGTWIGLLVVLVSAVSAASASAAFKPYSVVMSGDVGSSGPVAVATITNENKTQQLGSANLAAPPDYAVTSASTTQRSFTVVCDVTGHACVIQLRNAALAPGASLNITIGLRSVPCSSGTWGVEAKQSNDFSGTPGNDLNLDTANSVLTTTLCATSFTNGTAMTDAAPKTDAGLSGGHAQVTATAATGQGQLLESGNLATVSLVDCSSAARGGYTTADPNTYGVFTAGVDASKVVTITISSPTITLGGNATQILKSQQICFEAPYQFTTFAGTPAVSESTNTTTGPPPFIGLLQTCTGSTVGPCHNRRADSPLTGANGNVTGVVLVARIPSGLLPGDPRMG